MCAYLISPLGRAGPWWRTCCSPAIVPPPARFLMCLASVELISSPFKMEFTVSHRTVTCAVIISTILHSAYLHNHYSSRSSLSHIFNNTVLQVTPVVSTYYSEQRCKIVHVLKTHFVALRDRIYTFLHSSRAISPTLPPQCDKSVKLEIQKCSAGWSRVAAHQTLF